MELRHLRYFVCVVEEGSLHAASRRLNMAQPALSRRLKDLEAELGVNLLIRSVRGVSPSQAGMALFDHAKTMLSDLEDAIERTRRISLGREGSLRVGYSAMVTELRFPIAALARLKKALPDIDLKLSVMRSEEQVQALRTGHLDVGVLYRPAAMDDHLAYRDLRTHLQVLAVPKRHPLADRQAVRIEDLKGSQVILPLPAGYPMVFAHLLAACRANGVEPQMPQESQSETARLSMVAAGLALTFVSSSLLERRAPDDIVLLPIIDLHLELKLAVTWPKGTETPLLQAFLDALDAADRAVSQEPEEALTRA